MQSLNLPPCNLDIQNVDGKECIFDIIRKKYIILTPEEWVRQHFVHLLITHLKYPKSLIKLESGLKYNKIRKRTDIQVYDRKGNLFLIVECKAASIKLNKDVFAQIARYNFSLKSAYLAVTNGLQHFCCSVDQESQSIRFLENLPVFLD